MATPTPHPSQRPHLAAVVEDHFYAAAGWVLARAGWRPRLETYTGYGTPDRVRVLARVLIARPRPASPDRDALRAGRRGFRHFLTVPAPLSRVRVQVGGQTTVVTSDRAGYVDVELPVDPPLPTGWQPAFLTCLDGSEEWEADASLLVLDERTRFGVVSDIDDTTMVTAVPRPLLAAWNTFVRHSSARRAVPGMPELYRKLQRAHPDAAFFYLSTGAWNTAGTLRAFLSRHAYPAGPLLLTDWGPTLSGWFRSGPAHKKASLELLMSWFPHVRWVLVGDDGQHDVEIYEGVARRRPDRVRAVAIRRLTGGQQVLAGNAPHVANGSHAGTTTSGSGSPPVPTVAGQDGDELARRLADVPGVLDDQDR
ncbi:phosphatidate phosphatase APP1 [Promicromonospora sp. AC04]|uniref:App1 family protein n=1 Tax=Promicromonospora sp. AC04 TaxID=2135723 RepID=UPI000D383FC0|nr:phosphatase domain-containing protein [Promicromonospora sp. AC04]PUB28879.1 phosphatidate phosphatase APP1 [Promicromonospora sp. AC04]